MREEKGGSQPRREKPPFLYETRNHAFFLLFD
jgi:hypothetical protein